MQDLVFDDWQSLARTAIVTVTAYVALCVMLRVSGHRTLAKLNAFDFVITIALGSTLASTITSADISIAEGLLALFLLVALQYIVAKTTVSSKRLESAINGEPILLFHDGSFLWDSMRRARVTEDEVRAAARGQFEGDLSKVASVVLETNGDLSLVRHLDEDHVIRLPTKEVI